MKLMAFHPFIGAQIWRLLPKNFRHRLFFLIFLMIIGMSLEMLGIGLIIPTLAVIVENDIGSKYPILQPFFIWLGQPEHHIIVIGSMLVLSIIYLLKGLFLAFLFWKQNQFIFSFKADISQRLFQAYLMQPYTFHLQRNSAHLIKKIVIDNNELVDKALGPFSSLVTEFSILGGILFLLLVIEPLGTVALFCSMGFAVWLYQRVTHLFVLDWSEARLLHDDLRLQYLQQGLGGVKDVKILGKEGEFIRLYQYHNERSALVQQKRLTIEQISRLWIEAFSVVGLAILVITIFFQGKEIGTLIPTIGLFVGAAFRALPSVNRILASLHTIVYAKPIVQRIYEELKIEYEKIDEKKVSFFPFFQSILIQNVEFEYPSNAIQVLNSINLNIIKGTTVGFIGKSGSGKSTLIDIILGLLPPSQGTITVDGINIQTNIRGWQNQIGYVPQSIFLTDDTLRRNIAFGIHLDEIDDTAVMKALKAVQLEGFVKKLPEGLETKVGERGIRLSGGQRQRIGIARALYRNPSVLVLDEATSALDTETEKDIMAEINGLHGEKTILIVAHHLSTIEHCDQLYRLENGKIVDA